MTATAAGARRDDRAGGAPRPQRSLSAADDLLGRSRQPSRARGACRRSDARQPPGTLLGHRTGIWNGQFAYAEQTLGRALDYAGRSGDQRQEAEILRQLGVRGRVRPDAPWRRRSHAAEEIVELAPENRLIEAYALPLHGRVSRRAARRSPAPATCRAPQRSTRRSGMRLAAQAGAALAFGDVELLAGDDVAAERDAPSRARGARRDGRARLSARASRRSSRGRSTARTASTRRRRWRERAGAGRSAADDVWTQDAARAERARRCSRARRRRREPSGSPARRSACSRTRMRSICAATALLALAEVLRPRRRGRTETLAAATQALGLFEPKGNVVSAERSARRARDRAASSGDVTVSEGRAGPPS